MKLKGVFDIMDLGALHVLYMSSRFWLMGVESHDFAHASKAEQITKMTQQPKKSMFETSKFKALQ